MGYVCISYAIEDAEDAAGWAPMIGEVVSRAISGAAIKPPSKPARVFPGLIRGASFLLPKALPEK